MEPTEPSRIRAMQFPGYATGSATHFQALSCDTEKIFPCYDQQLSGSEAESSVLAYSIYKRIKLYEEGMIPAAYHEISAALPDRRGIILGCLAPWKGNV